MTTDRKPPKRHVTKRALLGVTAAIGAFVGGGAVYGWLVSAPRYKGPKSDHFDGKRFLNIQPTEHAGFTDMVKWMTSREEGEWEEWREIKPAEAVPARVSDGISITWINHASMLIQAGGVNILTDPIWSERCSPSPLAGPKRHHSPGIRFENLPHIDVVLLSHNHYDHLDVPSLQRLAHEHHPRIFAGLGNGAFLSSQHIRGAVDLDWWEAVDLAEGVRLHAVPAQHFSSRGFADRDANLWCGYVLETPAGMVYFAGDTGWGPHFDMIRRRLGPPRVALLPIGAFRPVWFMHTVHISPAEAVKAAQLLGAEVSVPMHYGTFHLGDDGQDEPVVALRSALEGSGVRFEVLKPGETLRLERGE